MYLFCCMFAELRLRSVGAAGAISSGGRYQSGAPTPAPAFNKTLQQLPPGVTPTPGSKITMQQRSMYGEHIILIYRLFVVVKSVVGVEELKEGDLPGILTFLIYILSH